MWVLMELPSSRRVDFFSPASWQDVVQGRQLWEAISPSESHMSRKVLSVVVTCKLKPRIRSQRRGRVWGSKGKNSRQRELQIQRLQGGEKGQWNWNVWMGREWPERRWAEISYASPSIPLATKRGSLASRNLSAITVSNFLMLNID